MIISGHQISFIPWIPYFDKIIKSDIFVIDDISQFEKGGHSNRNLIKTSQGPQYLTVPVQLRNYKEKKLNEIIITTDNSWKRKHYGAIKVNYSRAPYFKKYEDFLQSLYGYEGASLKEICKYFLEFVLEELKIKSNIVYASEIDGLVGKKSDFVLSPCKNLDADIYYSGKMGKNYLDLESFKENGIDIIFQDYEFKSYNQMFGEFVPGLSILDLLMNTGEASINYI